MIGSATSAPEAETGLPSAAYAAALATLPAMGPARLAAVLGRWSPEDAWRRVVAGQALAEAAVNDACRPDPVGVASVWRRGAIAVSVESVWEAHVEAGVGVHVLGGAGYPTALAADHEAPAVLFSRGDLGALEGRRAAIIGTRECTRYGREVAHELGRELAGRGVRVVSGLALGIDGAAHGGVLARRSNRDPETESPTAPPIAVVGSGLDIVYPRRHRSLWEEVVCAGLLLSEAPLGSPPEGWRFPARNRIIAALAEVVIVVESHMKGGSRHTVEAAESRAVPVMAVPGSVRSPASALPNALLAEGCHPVRDVLDILVALDLSTSGWARSVERRPPPSPEAAAVLDAMGWEASTLEEVVLRSGRTPAEVTLALAHLERDGWVAGTSGWWQRASPR